MTDPRAQGSVIVGGGQPAAFSPIASPHLMVADSSIFPTCPRCNIHFPVVAADEKIAATLL